MSLIRDAYWAEILGLANPSEEVLHVSLEVGSRRESASGSARITASRCCPQAAASGSDQETLSSVPRRLRNESRKGRMSMSGMLRVRHRIRLLTSRRWRVSLAALLSTGTLLAGVAMAAPASAYVGANFLRDWATGLCLDAGNGQANVEVYTSTCETGDPYQQWQPIYINHVNGNDAVQFRNLGTSGCLERTAGGDIAPTWQNCYFGDGSANGATAFEAHSVQDAWYAVNLIDEDYNTCLDSTRAGQAGPNPCNGGLNQMWRLGY